MNKFIYSIGFLILVTLSLTLLNQQNKSLEDVQGSITQLQINNNIKFEANCDLLSGYSIFKGCVKSPFDTQDQSQIVSKPVTLVKMNLNELSSQQVVTDLFREKYQMLGYSIATSKSELFTLSNTESLYQKSWILQDLRNFNYWSYASNQNLVLTEDAFQLLMNNPSEFYQQYGEMYVAAYVTGAYFTGIQTLSTNDANLFAQIKSLGSNLNEGLIKNLKQSAGEKLKVDTYLHSNFNLDQLTGDNIFDSYNKFQTLCTTDKSMKVSVYASRYDSFPSMMRNRAKFTPIYKESSMSLSRLRDSTVQKLNEVMQSYNIMLLTSQGQTQSFDRLIVKPQSFDITPTSQNFMCNSQKQIRSTQGTPQTVVILLDKVKVQYNLLLTEINQNLAQLNSLDLDKLIEIDNDSQYEPFNYEIIQSKFNTLSQQQQEIINMEKSRQVQEILLLDQQKNQLQKKQDQNDELTNDERQQGAERRSRDAGSRTQYQQGTLGQTIKAVGLNDKKSFVLNQQKMSYLSILVPFKDNEKCRKVTLNFNYKGQITVYTSQTVDHPTVNNAEFDFQTVKNDSWLGGKKLKKIEVLVKNENIQRVQNLYIGIYGEQSSSEYDFEAASY